MKRIKLIQLKAVFLLIVFGLNTAVGFACVVGLDIILNTTHHHNEEAAKFHVHGDSKKPEHHNETSKHQNDEKKDGAGCCNDDVLKFQSLDKNFNQNANTAIGIPIFIAIISSFLGIEFFKIVKTYPLKYRPRFFHPPPPDIRIAIQSFQI